MLENIKIGDKFMGRNGVFIVQDIYIKNNKYWVQAIHLESGQENHCDYNYFCRLELTKLDYQYIREATEEDYQDVKDACVKMLNDDMMGGFGRINFVDYSNIIIKLVKEFPKLVFRLEGFGLNVDKREER